MLFNFSGRAAFVLYNPLWFFIAGRKMFENHELYLDYSPISLSYTTHLHAGFVVKLCIMPRLLCNITISLFLLQVFMWNFTHVFLIIVWWHLPSSITLTCNAVDIFPIFGHTTDTLLSNFTYVSMVFMNSLWPTPITATSC